MQKSDVTSFFDPATNNISHVVADPETKACAVIDSLLDYDAAAGRTDTESADQLIGFVRDKGLTLEWIIDTHVHADHLTAAQYIKSELGGRTAIGADITQVQSVFGEIYNAGGSFLPDGSQFDYLFKDDETYAVGKLAAHAIHTPGHTPTCMTHVIGDACFVGDTLFMPDYGTARCDFPGGDAKQLYRSIQKIFSLPGETRMFLCHDYKAPGRDSFEWETTVREQQSSNIHVRSGISEREFVEMRTKRDATLSMPKLILPSIQVNMRAGSMPAPEENGTAYLKIPINRL